MTYLYVDTSFEQLTGLYDDHFKLIGWQHTKENKSSQYLHQQIDTLLVENTVKATELKGLIYCAGPGSYTGLRQTLSFAEVLKLSSISIHPFYHFEVPRLLGHKEGVFISKAFKGEIFLYFWGAKGVEKKLINSAERDQDLMTFTGEKFSINDEFISTQGLIKSEAERFFPLVIKEMAQKDLYYYRDLEVEFKVTAGQ